MASSVVELNTHRGEIEGQTDFRPVRLYLQHVGSFEQSRLYEKTAARVWTSVTPYAPARHLRSDNRFLRSLATEVNRELAARNLPEAVVARVLPAELRLPHPLEYRRHRLNERLADGRAAYHLRVTFDEPQHGPIALGAQAHFGLGRFRPAVDFDEQTAAAP